MLARPRAKISFPGRNARPALGAAAALALAGIAVAQADPTLVPVRDLFLVGGASYALAYDPDGTRLASGGELGDVVILDASTGAVECVLESLMRPPRYVPETIPISRLLRQFQATHQHLAFVADEYGNVIGIVTLENVLEQIVGPVEDEFDTAVPQVVPQGDGEFVVLGSALLSLVNRETKLDLETTETDTLSGLLTAKLGRIVEVGDRVDLDSATAEVLEVKGARASRVRLVIPRREPAE